jgi:hypothetical protein
MHKKIIFIDFDGTFFCDEKEPTKENITAVKRAKAKGHEIVFATGRSYPFIESINEQCGNVSRYAISGAGCIIYDLLEKKVVQSTPLPKPAVEAITKLGGSKVAWFLHCEDGSFSNLENFPYQNGTAGYFSEPIGEFVKTKSICQLWVGSPDFDFIRSLEPEILKNPGVYISNRHKHLVDPTQPKDYPKWAFYDIISTGLSKGSGIKFICDLLGFPKEHRIGIGDDMNDLSMFAEVGTSVAMGNSLKAVKEAATHQTDTNNNSGVAKFLDTL